MSDLVSCLDLYISEFSFSWMTKMNGQNENFETDSTTMLDRLDIGEARLEKAMVVDEHQERQDCIEIPEDKSNNSNTMLIKIYENIYRERV